MSNFLSNIFVWSILVIASTIMYSCSSSSQESEGSSSTPSKELAISQAEFGDKWPFTKDHGTIRCEEGHLIVFVADGIRYAINGSARGAVERMGYRDLEEIWKDHPEVSGFKIPVSAVIEKGKELCQ